ncbi:MAG: hypothetical protein MI742_13150, partial [Desulfobacterales bacterium]|nr:hypothetical protein [Desulfobacterales bacterium]
MKLSKREYYLSGTILLLLAMATSGWCSMAGMLDHKSEIIHPFISISGEYTDNLFSTEKNEEDDFFSRITPGVIIAIPKIDPDMVPIDSASYAPAGEMGTRIHQLDTMGEGMLQACVKYAPTFENYADYESRDIVTHQLDAYAMMKLRSGLAFELINQYRDNRDPVEEQTDSA